MNADTSNSCTVVTAGDRRFSWGVLMLVASMRRNGMKHPVVIGALDWPPEMKERVSALGGVTIRELPPTKMCLTCQKPLLMSCDDVRTEWVCWADGDGAFEGDCSEWLTGSDPDEIVVRRYKPAPADFTPQNLETWRRDVERFRGAALERSRYDTRVNASFIVVNRKHLPFLRAWQDQIGKVLPPDVEIIMEHGSAYFQTDESVLGSLLCFLPSAPIVSKASPANADVDMTRYVAHFAYNPKPWQMWNSNSLKWRSVIMPVVDYLIAENIVKPSDLPLPLRRSWWPLWRACAWTAPWVWRATKLKRRIFG